MITLNANLKVRVNEQNLYISILQECVPEDLELKRKVFQQLDQHASSNMVLASSSSCIASSQFSSDLQHRDRVLIVHPVSHISRSCQ